MSRRATPQPRRKRRWVRVLSLLVLLVLASGLSFLYGCTIEWLPMAIVASPNRGNVALPKVEAAPAVRPDVKGVRDALRVRVGPPDATLSVWIMDPAKADAPNATAPRGTILALHGIRDQKRSMRGVGGVFADAGYRVVLVDLRGHGESTGDALSYGAFDGHDLSQVLDALDERGLLAGPVGAYGPSYGGAAALQLAARDDRVRAVVAIATFTRMRDIVPVYVRRFLPMDGLISDRQIQAAVDEAGDAGGYNPDDADSVAAIRKTRARVLIVHGDADANIPLAHAQELHAAANDHSELIIVSGADHTTIFSGDTGRVVLRRAVAWFDEHFPVD